MGCDSHPVDHGGSPWDTLGDSPQATGSVGCHGLRCPSKPMSCMKSSSPELHSTLYLSKEAYDAAHIPHLTKPSHVATALMNGGPPTSVE